MVKHCTFYIWHFYINSFFKIKVKHAVSYFSFLYQRLIADKNVNIGQLRFLLMINYCAYTNDYNYVFSYLTTITTKEPWTICLSINILIILTYLFQKCNFFLSMGKKVSLYHFLGDGEGSGTLWHVSFLVSF